MPDPGRYFITTAIDYPNSRPHIGTAFEKIGADVQARYRRMQGDRVHFLMGNDENTVKVARRAAELGKDVKAYCDDMANHVIISQRRSTTPTVARTSAPRSRRSAPTCRPGSAGWRAPRSTS